MEKCSASSRSSRLAMHLVNYKEKGGGLMRCLIFHGSSCVCSFSDHDVAKTLHYGVKEEVKKKGNESPQFVITDIAVYLETCKINPV
jgi:hypothetical protein